MKDKQEIHGKIGLATPNQPRLEWSLPYSVALLPGGRGWGRIEPPADSTQDFVVVQQGQRIVAHDGATGRKLWTAPWRLAGGQYRFGKLKQVGPCLLVSTTQGLCRLDKRTGELVWIRPEALQVISDSDFDKNGRLLVVTSTGPCDHD